MHVDHFAQSTGCSAIEFAADGGQKTECSQGLGLQLPAKHLLLQHTPSTRRKQSPKNTDKQEKGTAATHTVHPAITGAH